MPPPVLPPGFNWGLNNATDPVVGIFDYAKKRHDRAEPGFRRLNDQKDLARQRVDHVIQFVEKNGQRYTDSEKIHLGRHIGRIEVREERVSGRLAKKPETMYGKLAFPSKRAEKYADELMAEHKLLQEHWSNMQENYEGRKESKQQFDEGSVRSQTPPPRYPYNDDGQHWRVEQGYKGGSGGGQFCERYYEDHQGRKESEQQFDTRSIRLQTPPPQYPYNDNGKYWGVGQGYGGVQDFHMDREALNPYDEEWGEW